MSINKSKTEELREKVAVSIRRELVKNPKLSNEYVIERSDEIANQILKACKEAGMVFVDREAKPKNPYRRANGEYSYCEQPYEADAYDLAQVDMTNWNKTEEIEVYGYCYIPG